MYINCSAKLFSVEGDIKYYNILHIHIKYYIKKKHVSGIQQLIMIWKCGWSIHSKEQTIKRLSYI